MLRSRLLALLMALAVLGPSTAAASIVYVCKMTGESGPRCCCKAKSTGKSGEKRAPAEFERPACCAAHVTRTADIPAIQHAPDLQVLPPALLETHPLLALAATQATSAAGLPPRSRAPPPRGPPLYLENCTLLN